jgi:Glycosyltransferase family 87
MPRIQRAAVAQSVWFAAVVVASVVLAYANGSAGDYPSDAGPAIRALLDGHVGQALASQPVMGSLSVIVRLPFAALASLTGGGELAAYRLGCIPCLVALGLAGLALARAMSRAGAKPTACGAAAVICLVNPLTWEALRLGHPEELLGAAFVVAAALYAAEGRSLTAGVALGLALATKQWAAIAVLPVFAVAPARRIRLGMIALAVVAALTLPVVIADANGFYGATRQAGWAGERVYPFNAVWPLAPTEDRVISVGGDMSVVTVRVIPTWLAHVLHPGIVALAIPLTAAALLVRRRFRADDVFALLALAFLLRCLLDPVDNAYYHVPFVLSLAFWEGLAWKRAPLLALLASLAVWFAFYKATMFHSTDLRNAVYLIVTVPFALSLFTALFARGDRSAQARQRELRPAPATGG